MKKINLKILNAAFWVELILSYVLPFKVADSLRYKVGFPVAFITVYDAEIGVNPFMSMSLNPLSLLFNVIVIYFVISACVGAYHKLKCKFGRTT